MSPLAATTERLFSGTSSDLRNHKRNKSKNSNKNKSNRTRKSNKKLSKTKKEMTNRTKEGKNPTSKNLLSKTSMMVLIFPRKQSPKMTNKKNPKKKNLTSLARTKMKVISSWLFSPGKEPSKPRQSTTRNQTAKPPKPKYLSSTLTVTEPKTVETT